MSTNIKYDYYVPYYMKKMKLSKFQLDIHMSAYQNLQKSPKKCIYLQNFFQIRRILICSP